MNKEMKGLILEIVSLVVLLIVVIPVCVNASNRYNDKRDMFTSGDETRVDILNRGDKKEVVVSSLDDEKVMASLMLKISEFEESYLVYLEDGVYSLDSLSYETVGDERHYNLGVYAIDGERSFLFALKPVEQDYFNETIRYSFYTESIV